MNKLIKENMISKQGNGKGNYYGKEKVRKRSRKGNMTKITLYG